MIGELITWMFLGGALLFGAGVAFFIWLNFKSSTIDDKSYDSDFKPEEMVSKYRYERDEPEDSYDAAHALRHYAHHGDPEEALTYDADDGTQAELEEPLEPEEDPVTDTSLMPSAKDSRIIDVPHPKHSKRDPDRDIVDADVIPETKSLPKPDPKLEEK